MKKVIVINLGWEQEPMLDMLQSYDVELYGIHYDEDYYKKPEYKDVLISDLRDLEKILNYAKEIQPDAVISDQCDYSYFAQALIAETFNLIGPRVKEAQIATNKYLQRLKAKESGVLIPKFKLCTSVDDVYEFAKEFGYPIITKPVDNRGSFGVNKINDYNDIFSAFEDAVINSNSKLVIVEEFISGTHITVDGYCFKETIHKSLAMASKQLTFGKRQVAMDIQYPAPFENDFYNRVLKVNEDVNKVLGFKFGFTHSEYMITSDFQIYLIESANRGGGVYTSEIIVPNVSGIDILKQYISDTLDISNDFSTKNIEKNKIVLKFFNFKPGVIKEIRVEDEFLSKKEILKIKFFIKEGDIINEITTDANRHGFVIAKNENLDIDKEIVENIRVIYEK